MKVGDYVRYKTLSNQIKINKIKNIVEPDDSELSMTNIILYDLDNKDVTADKYIIKSSPNIIDLIEVGDYVNGYKVTSKDQFLGFGNYDWYMTNDEIKSIVTKEMYSSAEYRVENN